MVFCKRGIKKLAVFNFFSVSTQLIALVLEFPNFAYKGGIIFDKIAKV